MIIHAQVIHKVYINVSTVVKIKYVCATIGPY